MRAVVFAVDHDERRRICRALQDDEIEHTHTAIRQDFCTHLYRDHQAVGVFRLSNANVAAMSIREFRLAEVRNPALVLVDRIEGRNAHVAGLVRILNAGADDVQPWGIHPSEMVARLRALGARDRGVGLQTVEFAGCVYNLSTGVIVSQAGSVMLSKKEDELLNFFVHRPLAIVSKTALMEHLYAGRDEPDIKIIDVFICKLRAKLLRIAGERDVIETAWGQGYRFIPEGVVPNMSTARQRVSA